MAKEIKGAQGIIINKRNEVLLVKRRREKVWVIPGGHVDQGETIEQAALRELHEETGILGKIISKVGEYESPILVNGKTVLFLCETLGGKFKINGEVSEIKYWNLNELPLTLVPWHHERIRDALKLKDIPS